MGDLDSAPPTYCLQVVICKEKTTEEILAMKIIKKDMVEAKDDITYT